MAFPDRPSWHVCHETIYQALYHGDKGGLSRDLTLRLRTGRPLRKRRRSSAERRIRFIAPASLIDLRPGIVEARQRIGDREGDLIVGRMSGSATGTLVDRRSRYVRLARLPCGHGAEQLRIAIGPVPASLPGHARLTLTRDQGSEMACHDKLTGQFRDGIFFARPGSPWQRGSNENVNGLLRQYFPKRTDLSVFTLQDLRDVEQKLNGRPRKILGWQTPAQIFSQSVQRSTVSVATIT
jgi:transposase, IS30 family